MVWIISTLTSIGHFFFRTRNIVFPMLLLAVLFVFPPQVGHGGLTTLLLFAGLAVLLAGQGLRVATIGLDYIRRGGKDGRIYASRLVTGGLFAHCRNPMYTSNVLIAVGFFMVSGNPAGLVLGALCSWFIYAAIIRSEEDYLAAEFGDAYRAYCHDVPRWLPRPRGLLATLHSHRFDWAAVVIREYGTLYTTVLITLALLCWKTVEAGAMNQFLVAYLAVLIAASLAYALARYLKKTRKLRPMKR